MAYACPFCNSKFPLAPSTYKRLELNFEYDSVALISSSKLADVLRIEFYQCPECSKPSIYAIGKTDNLVGVRVPIYPSVICKHFPEYVPAAIRKDYEEACAIVNLSPKASAALLRRCLQGMIRDFWQIRKKTLAEEINALEGKVAPTLWKVIDGVRRIGNIGAHMENDVNLIVDIEPDEASKLIMLIEKLISSWYIERHEQESLYDDIINIDSAKQQQRSAK